MATTRGHWNKNLLVSVVILTVLTHAWYLMKSDASLPVNFARSVFLVDAQAEENEM